MNNITYNDNNIYNLLEYFITKLSKEEDEICNDHESDVPFYKTLVNLMCKENIKELPEHFVITKPFFPYILLSYYILFHKGNLDLAKDIYERLLNIYRDNSNIFNRDERTSLKMIGEVIEFFDILRELDDEEHKNILKYYLEFLTAKIDKINCTNTCNCFFKDLLISQLEPDFEKGYEKLSSMRKNYQSNHVILDEEIIEGYNLFLEEEFSSACMLLLDIIKMELHSLEHIHQEIFSLEIKKREIENKPKIIKWLVRRNLKKIEVRMNGLKNFNVERIKKIIS